MGKVVFFYPKQQPVNALAEALRAAATLTIDDKTLGTVAEGKQISLTLAPGQHRVIVGDTLFKQGTPITVRPGQMQYFVITSVAGLAFREVDAATAKAELSGKAPAGTATLYFYWPRALLDLGLDALKQEVVVSIDGKRVGGVISGYYIVAHVAAGKHRFAYDSGGFHIFGPPPETTLFLSAGQTRYYQFHYYKYVELYERTAEQGRADIAKLKRR